jgi:hypothetical protein
MSSSARPTKKQAKKPRGWGPFRSVLKERSVDFNLTLDVQSLQQQVQHLTTLRDVLSTRTTLRRHSPEGSLFHVVKEYFHVFRTGWVVQEVGRKRLLDEQDQRQFLHSVMDPEVDVDNGLKGPDVMAEQLIMYSTFIKFIRLTMKSYDIVVADDSVVVQTKSRLRFRVLRNTIESIFPHVIGDECLVAQLVGQELEPMVDVTFFFNSTGKCCKYKVDLDFVEAFAGIVKDPSKLDKLFGRALIAENSMFGLIEMPAEVEEVTTGMDGCSTFERALEDERDCLVEELDEIQRFTGSHEGAPLRLPSKPQFLHNDTLFKRAVNAYYHFYEEGLRGPGKRSHSEGDFLSQLFVPDEGGAIRTSSRYVLERWRVLRERFGVLGFRQEISQPVEYDDQEDTCTIRSTASYTLRLTPHTIRSVFPHVLAYKPLAATLVGSILVVPSELVFSIEMESGRISRVIERMDFIEPLAELLQSNEDVSFVMSQALLSLDGGSRTSPARRLPPLVLPKTTRGRHAAPETHSAVNARRSMTMDDILAA